MPQKGCGPNNDVAEAVFANLSAASFPLMPECPGTQQSVKLFLLPNSDTEARQSHTNLELNSFRRLMSYQVAVEYSYSGNTARNKEKTKKIAFFKTNACKIGHEAVKRVNPVATEEVVKTWMGKWLQQAKYRLDRKSSEAGGGVEVGEEIEEEEVK
ncbi:uncharacterized protein LOC129003609 [Macrosteles quadrilineatus]|uniref:uncharacterized protein LOC129003609 n=1 Tax=Macrosteles quadrilineatus TaxID=74068 RepID=UPI0023E2FF08|nr:uncharacterized protein LOC129003609 [Macrosteles quadrilineatus]